MTIAAITPILGVEAGNAMVRTSPAIDGADGFGTLLSRVGATAIENLKAADRLSLQAFSGEASVREVASAVMVAEQTLQLSLSVRDKIVSAYLELSRMQI